MTLKLCFKYEVNVKLLSSSIGRPYILEKKIREVIDLLWF